MKRLVLKGDNIQLIKLKALKTYISEYNFADIQSDDNIFMNNRKNVENVLQPEYEQEDSHLTCMSNEDPFIRAKEIEISLQYKSSYFILINIDQELIYKLYDLLDGRMFNDDIIVQCFIIDHKLDCGVKIRNRDAFDLKLKGLDNEDTTNIDQNISEESDETKKPVLTNKQLKKREHKKQRKQKKIEQIKERISKRDGEFVFDPDDQRFSAIHTDKRFKIIKK